MTQKTTLKSRLKAYSALAGTMVAAGNTAHAQMVYTDVIPDTTVSLGLYDLDLNNDGIKDFTLAQANGTVYGYSYMAVAIAPDFSLNCVDTASNGFPAAVNAGFTVDSTLNWVDSANIYGTFAQLLALSVPAFSPTYDLGNFRGQSNKYLPLKFDVEGEIYYGWVRLGAAANASSFTVKDYAYNNPGNSASTTVGISEAALNNEVNIYSFEKNVIIDLDKNVPVKGVVTISNTIGQEVLSTPVNNSKMTIPLQGVVPGIYLVTIAQDNSSYTKRVLIH